MEHKYYTPTIEEFHVGFEHEEKSSGLWTSQIYNEFSPIINREVINEHDDRVDTIELYLKCEAIRVKHLDREDIESLGFEHRGGKTFKYKKDKGTWLLITDDGMVDIAFDGGDTKFHGTINNKSELKRILKQINVIN